MPDSSSPSTISPKSRPPLAHQINATTRRTHTILNQLILQLLPLALPPNTNDASLYAAGMSYILLIYRAFETSFSDLLALPPALRSPLIQALAEMHMPALERAEILLGDLKRLSPISTNAQQDQQSSRPEISQNTKDRTNSAGPTATTLPPQLLNLTTHIITTLPQNPHLLLTYTHIFYLALFSGGRYIRSCLHAAGDTITPRAGLRFWYFEEEEEGGQEGGLKIKEEFKRIFEVVAELLEDWQREEVVREAAGVMEGMVGVVEEIRARVQGCGRPLSAPLLDFAAGEGEGEEEEEEEEKKRRRERTTDSTLAVRWVSAQQMSLYLPMGLVELVSTGIGHLLWLGRWDAGPPGRGEGVVR